MKKVAVLLFVLILSLSATAFAAYNGQTFYVVNCRESITLREDPSVYSAEITQIPLGAAVTFLDNAGNGFYRINYDGLIGFALASYLAPSSY